MAVTQTTTKIQIASLRRFTAHEYARLIETGILSEDERVELIEGEIINMAPIGSRHAGTVNTLIMLLSSLVAARRVVVAPQNPVHLDEYSEPQPDVVIARVRPDNYRDGHPTPSDILFLIEIMDTTQEYDRKVKLPLYARAGVAETWLIDLASSKIEAYQEPSSEGYRATRVYTNDEMLSPVLLPEFIVRVFDILPPQ